MYTPVLFCYDGSEGSKSALAAGAELVMHPAEAVVLAVWMPAAVLLARGGSLMAAAPYEEQIDEREAAEARRIAEEGAAAAGSRGYQASARTARADESVAKTIGQVAEEIEARLIVCGQRGRGSLTSALLGSVSRALSAQAKRPVLIAPQRRG